MKRDVLNKLLLLRLINAAGGEIRGVTRLQKMVFASEARSRNTGNTNTFNYKFIRWHYGPYSKELKDDLNVLITSGYIRIKEPDILLTKKGRKIVDDFGKQLNKISDIDTIDQTVRDYRGILLRDLLQQVYQEYDVTSYNMGEVIQPLKYFEVSESEYV